MDNFLLDISLIFVLILLNGFFTGSEIAIISLKQIALEELRKKGDLRGRLIAHFKRQPERFFATVQIGVTLLSTLASVYGGSRLMSYLSPQLQTVDSPMLSPYIEELALAVLVLAISYLSLVFGELVPKSLALRYAGIVSYLVAYPLYFFSRIFSPFTFLLTFSSNLVLRIFHKQTSFSETRLHEEEIRQILKEGVQMGSIEHTEQQLISNVFEINDTSAREIMTPRVNMTALSLDAPIHEVEGIIYNSSYSRIPVYRESLDKIEGILHTKDFIKMRSRPNILNLKLEEILRPAHHVPESMKIDKILAEMQSQRTHAVIVVDEYGGTAGVITMEDIVEEIVGSIQDGEEEQEEEVITSLPQGRYLLAGSCSIGEFNEHFPAHPLPESEGYNSLAGFIIEEAGRFPEVGEKIQCGELEFELLRRVRQTLVQFRMDIKDMQNAGANETQELHSQSIPAQHT